jgi:hypothetical protein
MKKDMVFCEALLTEISFLKTSIDMNDHKRELLFRVMLINNKINKYMDQNSGSK